MRAVGETALYEAIKAGIEMTDAAHGEPDAIRGVVVLTDGQANRCETRLDDLIVMEANERTVEGFSGCKGDPSTAGREEVIGIELAFPTDSRIQIFFIGIGEDADLEVGRLLAQATGAEFQGVVEEDLASVLEEYSKYF